MSIKTTYRIDYGHDLCVETASAYVAELESRGGARVAAWTEAV